MGHETVVIFESDDGPEMDFFKFGMREAFAIRLNKDCTLKRVDFPIVGPSFRKNIERAIDRARKLVREQHAAGQCVYVTASALPLDDGQRSFDLAFAFALMFHDARMLGSKFEVFGEVPREFAEHEVTISAGMENVRPIIGASVQESEEAQRFINATFDGIRIAQGMLDCDITPKTQ